MSFSRRQYRELIASLIERGAPHTPAIVDAFRLIDRSDFLPPNLRGRAYENVPLPIGFGQMTTEPFVVGFMLEQLQPQPDDRVLEVGAGAGWQTALLCHIVGDKGQVTALEIVPELKTFCENNLAKYHFPNITVILGDGSKGWPAAAPYHRITVSAAVEKDIPKPFVEQLAIGGRLIIPVGRQGTQSLVVVERLNAKSYREKKFHGFAFVPMMTHNAL